jgi:hypothetical protein
MVAGTGSIFALALQRASHAQETVDPAAPFVEEQKGDPESDYESVRIDPIKVAGLTLGSTRAAFNPRNPEFRTTLLDVARRFVGMDRTNNEEEIVAFLDMFDLPFKDKSGAFIPYCAAGLTYAAAVAYEEFWNKDEASTSITRLRGALPELDYYHFYGTPSVQDMYYVARGRRRWIEANPEKPPKPGYVVIYSFGREADHCGIVESVDGSKLTTIEFNTSNGLRGSQRNGGMVARRTRAFDAQVKGFIATDAKA